MLYTNVGQELQHVPFTTCHIHKSDKTKTRQLVELVWHLHSKNRHPANFISVFFDMHWDSKSIAAVYIEGN